MTFLFLGLKVIFKNLGRVGDFFWCNFENHTYKVPSGSSEALHRGREAAEFTGGWMGWDGMGYQKCPSIFFILCVYVDHVYMHLYI